MGPLAGIKVLDLSQIVSGPMATAWLADQGAEVLKIESPTGDPVRTVGARKGRMSALYVSVNRGKRAEVLDFKNPAQRARFHELVVWADVLVENFRPGTMEKLGLGEAHCRALNPRLVWCAITGFGPDGPYAGLRAYDPVVQAASGLAAIQASADGTPQLIGTILCDKVAALTAAQAITAALFHRERTGEAQRVDIAMLDAAIAFAWPDGMYNQAFRDPADPAPDYARLGRLWPAKDGHVALGALQDIEFEAIRASLGNPEALADPAYNSLAGRLQDMPRVFGSMAAEVAKRTKAELMQGFLASGTVGCVVNSRDDVVRDPQVVHNGCLVEVEQPGCGGVRVARHPVRFSATPVCPLPAAAPDPFAGEQGALRAIIHHEEG